MSEPIYHSNKLVITAAQASQGFKLLGANFDFAYVRTNDENQLLVIPIRKKLKLMDVRLEAIDFLKFREGIYRAGKPWQYLMIINGLHKIEISEEAEHIAFEKMPEVPWDEILPSLKEMMKLQKEVILALN